MREVDDALEELDLEPRVRARTLVPTGRTFGGGERERRVESDRQVSDVAEEPRGRRQDEQIAA